MLHSKESHFAHVNGFAEVVQEITSDWTDEIKSHAKNKLDMRNGCSGVTGKVIKFCKGEI